MNHLTLGLLLCFFSQTLAAEPFGHGGQGGAVHFRDVDPEKNILENLPEDVQRLYVKGLNDVLEHARTDHLSALPNVWIESLKLGGKREKLLPFVIKPIDEVLNADLNEGDEGVTQRLSKFPLFPADAGAKTFEEKYHLSRYEKVLKAAFRNCPFAGEAAFATELAYVIGDKARAEKGMDQLIRSSCLNAAFEIARRFDKPELAFNIALLKLAQEEQEERKREKVPSLHQMGAVSLLGRLAEKDAAASEFLKSWGAEYAGRAERDKEKVTTWVAHAVEAYQRVRDPNGEVRQEATKAIQNLVDKSLSGKRYSEAPLVEQVDIRTALKEIGDLERLEKLGDAVLKNAPHLAANRAAGYEQAALLFSSAENHEKAKATYEESIQKNGWSRDTVYPYLSLLEQTNDTAKIGVILNKAQELGRKAGGEEWKSIANSAQMALLGTPPIATGNQPTVQQELQQAALLSAEDRHAKTEEAEEHLANQEFYDAGKRYLEAADRPGLMKLAQALQAKGLPLQAQEYLKAAAYLK